MRGISLVVQWLKLQASNAEGTGSIPGQGTKIPHATWHGQNIKIIINKVKHITLILIKYKYFQKEHNDVTSPQIKRCRMLPAYVGPHRASFTDFIPWRPTVLTYNIN